MGTTSKTAIVLILAFASPAAVGCVLGVVYNLPIPFETYATGAAVAVVASFVVVAYLERAPTTKYSIGPIVASATRTYPVRASLTDTAPWVSVATLVLSIATGFVGSTNPLANFNMTLFWIAFTLGLTYATAFLGDIYSWANPWRALYKTLERVRPTLFRGVARYPMWLGYYPALTLYFALIWIELFGAIRPAILSALLIGYSLLNLTMAWLFGKETWLRYGELFSVFFRQIALIAPVAYVRLAGAPERLGMVVRRPFVGLLEARTEHVSLLLFILFMLSSTAFDGAHESLPWVALFWQHLYPPLSTHSTQPYAYWVRLYYDWQSWMLVLSPFAYLTLYLSFLWLAKIVTRIHVPLRALALRFAFTLIPIALVYNVAHYFGELVSQGLLIVRMVSDPFNVQWNLFGTAHWLANPVILDAGLVWHMQIGLIVAGHIVSVYLAHLEALKVFPNRGRAIVSQLPMLALMVVLTTVGLWILSLPLDAGETAAQPGAVAMIDRMVDVTPARMIDWSAPSA